MDKYKLDFIINYRNKEVKYSDLNNIFSSLGIDFKITNNIELFIQALTHESYAVDISNYQEIYQLYKSKHPSIVFLKKDNYERLEFLGDSIIKPIISIYLYTRYPYAHEGLLSTLRTKIESTKTLSHFFKCLKLQEYILISNVVEQEGGRDNPHILEDCFESFIGALYNYSIINNGTIDNIMHIIQQLINKLIESELNLSELIKLKDYKGELNIYCQHMKFPIPKYIQTNVQKKLTKYNGKYTTNKEMYEYTVYVIVNNIKYGPCTNIILKEAEQNAAKIALDHLTYTDENDDIFYA